MQSQPQNQKETPREDVSINLDELPRPELTGHGWRQQGTMLLCESCPFTHTSFIPVGYQLYGIGEDGLPRIKKLEY